MCITISIMLEKLRLFLVVLEEGSLRRAADRLRISQSAITRQMQSLELDLGGRVLERTSAGVRPTNGGHVPRTEDMPLPKAQKRCWQIMIPPWLKSAGWFAEKVNDCVLAILRRPSKSILGRLWSCCDALIRG